MHVLFFSVLLFTEVEYNRGKKKSAHITHTHTYTQKKKYFKHSSPVQKREKKAKKQIMRKTEEEKRKRSS